MRIGVLMGGMSSEREVSIRSGTAVYEALIEKGYNAVKIDVSRNIAGVLKKKKIDIAFIALHGRYGEDGAIQGLLEIMGIPYTGSGVMASAMAFDKVVSKEVFKCNGIPTPEFWVARCKMKDARKNLKLETCNLKLNFDFPLVLKPARGGSTIGLTVVREKRHIAKALKEAMKFDSKIIIERFINGRELTVGVLNGKTLPVIEIKPKGGIYDFRSKYTKGMTDYIVPAYLDERIEKRVRDVALSAYIALGCRGAARVDIMLDKKDKPYVLEVNTIPGMTNLSLLPKAADCAGMSFPQLVENMLLEVIRK